jgi:hypothetical protein
MESPPTKFTFIHEAAPGVSLSDRARASVEESGILTTIPIDKPCERLDNTHRPEGADGHAGPHGRPAPLPGKQQRDSSHCIKAMKVKHPRNAPKAGPGRNPSQEPTDRPQRPIPSPLARNRPP